MDLIDQLCVDSRSEQFLNIFLHNSRLEKSHFAIKNEPHKINLLHRVIFVRVKTNKNVTPNVEKKN